MRITERRLRQIILQEAVRLGVIPGGKTHSDPDPDAAQGRDRLTLHKGGGVRREPARMRTAAEKAEDREAGIADLMGQGFDRDAAARIYLDTTTIPAGGVSSDEVLDYASDTDFFLNPPNLDHALEIVDDVVKERQTWMHPRARMEMADWLVNMHPALEDAYYGGEEEDEEEIESEEESEEDLYESRWSQLAGLLRD